MGAGVKVLACCFNCLHTEFGQDPEELLECQFHTLDERRIASIRPGRLDRPLHVIDNRQQFFEKLFIPESNLLTLVTLSQPFIVFKFGSQSEVFVIDRFTFFSLAGQFGLN